MATYAGVQFFRGHSVYSADEDVGLSHIAGSCSCPGDMLWTSELY